ncbi:MAG: tetratricopeptide repeat protein, partial [Dehalococcoidia bacterium]|nr:tetratricopeptide repeat protein [Dehalococcoidia bacterium]
GYSRLMGEDEEATVRTITAYREIIAKVVQKQRGRVVDSPGDNILAEFASVVDAVRSAVEIQEELKTKNAELPDERKMEFRIGVNLGDVIHEEERIYGDGVNIAARVEGLADGGGICISGTVYEHIKNKLELGYEYLGEHSVKNIAEPVRVYKVLMDPDAFGKVIGEEKVEQKRGQGVALAVIIALLMVVGGGVIWKSFLFTPSPPVEVASVEKMAFPLPDRPSIAVLPFVNMSDDPKQEYFSDGITEDLITDLSKISGLFVIARNSTFAYKGKSVKVKQVAQELGVRYVLEGSVRKAAEQVRINAQLIDAGTGHHLWAERYDGKMGDIFALQDRITQKIVAALTVKLTAGEQERFAVEETSSIDAYDAFLQGWEHYLRRTPDDFAKALPYFQNAIELDPNYGRAYAALALTYLEFATYGWLWSTGDLNPTTRIRAQLYLERAMKYPTSVAHRVASDIVLTRRKHQEALAEAEQAITMDPNDAESHLMMAEVLLFIGRPEEAITSAKKAMLLDPRNIAFPLGLQGLAYFCMEQFKEAASLMERALKLNPNRTGFASTLAAAYAHLGRNQEARSALDVYTKPWLIPASLRRVMYYFPFKNLEDGDRFAEGLLRAGLPGEPSGYYKASEEHRLTGEEIKELFFAHIQTGLWAGRPWSISRTREGKAALLLDTKVIARGKSWIEGDMLIHQWEKRYEGLKYYISVFRNPEGTPQEKNEYILLSDWNIYGVSLED